MWDISAGCTLASDFQAGLFGSALEAMPEPSNDGPFPARSQFHGERHERRRLRHPHYRPRTRSRRSRAPPSGSTRRSLAPGRQLRPGCTGDESRPRRSPRQHRRPQDHPRTHVCGAAHRPRRLRPASLPRGHAGAPSRRRRGTRQGGGGGRQQHRKPWDGTPRTRRQQDRSTTWAACGPTTRF